MTSFVFIIIIFIFYFVQFGIIQYYETAFAWDCSLYG